MTYQQATKTLAFALVALLAVPTVLGVDPGTSPTAPIAALCGTVSGVVSEENGAPIEGATVVAVPATSGTALTFLGYAGDETADDGSYSFELTQGRWSVVVVHEGGNYQTANADVVFTCTNQVLPFTLAPTVAIGNPARGTFDLTLVEDVDGNNAHDNVSAPMAGVEVTVYLACAANTAGIYAIRREGYVASGVTDAAGHLSLVLPTTNIRSFCLSMDISTSYIDTGNVPRDNDGTYDNDQTISISADTTTTLALNFTKKLRNVEFVVSDFDVADRNVGSAALTVFHPIYCPGGVKPANVWERYSCTATAAAATTDTTEAGKVKVVLPIDGATSFSVRAVHPQYFTHADPCTVTNSPRTNVANNPGNTAATQNELSCTIQVGHVSRIVSGRVVDGGVPVAGASVTFDGVLDLDDKTIITGADGRFAVNLRTDDFTVTAFKGAGTMNECMTLDGTVDFDLGDLDFAQDEVVISGTVKDPIDGALLSGTIVRFKDPENNSCQVAVGPAGTFSLSVPRDTDYTVIAGDDADENYDFKAGQVALTLAGDLTGPTKDVGDMNLVRRDGKLKVTVREDREPDQLVPGALVSCSSSVTGHATSGTTASNGAILFRVPYGGGYTCSATKAGGMLEASPASPAVTVVKDDGNPDTTDETSVSLLMQRLIYTVTGTVTDAISEAPIAGASVELRNLACLVTGGPTCLAVALTAADGTYSVNIPYIAMTGAPARMNAVVLLVSQIDYEPIGVAGVIGPDGRVPTEVRGDHAMIPNEGKLAESADTDGDRVPEAVEAAFCSTIESDSDPSDGTCDGDDWSPPF